MIEWVVIGVLIVWVMAQNYALKKSIQGGVQLSKALTMLADDHKLLKATVKAHDRALKAHAQGITNLTTAITAPEDWKLPHDKRH